MRTKFTPILALAFAAATALTPASAWAHDFHGHWGGGSWGHHHGHGDEWIAAGAIALGAAVVGGTIAAISAPFDAVAPQPYYPPPAPYYAPPVVYQAPVYYPPPPVVYYPPPPPAVYYRYRY
jgi:hypothetical protein